METVKEILAYFLSPLVLFFVAQVVAFLCAILQRHQTSTVISLASIAMLFVASIPVVTTDALRAKENKFAPLHSNKLDSIDADAIAVLGTSYQSRQGFPPNSEISPQFLARLVEGVRISRSVPDAGMVVFVSGRKGTPQEKEAFLQSMCRILAIDHEKVNLVTGARSTAEEALSVQARTSGPVIVVTSARHMPRAMATFEAAGIESVAAPTNYEIPPADSGKAGFYTQWIPSTAGLWQTRSWIYETAASMWLKVTSRG
ncbi:MAG: ElyC/SanA/YdcF family protein [Verrucomicrobiales bacterium]|nr:ElyC/SanA/YdcF family protein [Verrucomicrobiales bacterium]